GGFVSISQTSSGEANSQVAAEIDVVGGDYLQTMGVRLLEGRWFRQEQMSETSDAAIVSEFAASRLWPGATAIGQRICVYCTAQNPHNWKRVVGVVSSTRHASLNEAIQGSAVYLSAGAMQSAVFLVV